MQIVPHLNTWRRLLAQRQGDEQAALIAAAIQRCYAVLLDQRQPSLRPSQSKRLRQLVLLGLALYQTLKEFNTSQEGCLAETEHLFKATLFLNERRFTAWINHLPDPFPLVRLMLRQVERASHVEAEQEIVEDSPQCFAFNTLRCFLLEVLRLYQALELAPLYCKTDDWMAEAMPKVPWLRTKILGRGDAVCDFRWERV
ncbi:MAG: hypothetical protein A2Z71_08095 [Chloroflexi bacterium RBG_13_50_21]|nr:MAG: hypothetical protein A2Z71_08095 [Chloroflexi bacterium RBG_13_50_21]